MPLGCFQTIAVSYEGESQCGWDNISLYTYKYDEAQHAD